MKLYADSATDLPLAFFREHDVELIPLHVEIGGASYRDIVEIDSKEIFRKIRGGDRPKTSQASPEEFIGQWESLARSGEKGLYIAFSSELSGTYSTAVMMRDQVMGDHPGLDLEIIDTKCASLGYGLLLIEAARLREEGRERDEIADAIRQMAARMVHLFTVEDLDYLAKGGRLSRAGAFIGGLLNIKPLLHVEDGKLVPIEKHRGRKKVFQRMNALMGERGSGLSRQRVAISHGDDEEAALALKSLIEETHQPESVDIHMIGSVIGSHAGPGTIALFFQDLEAGPESLQKG
ncbi:DegV family protein [Edaphobacillus lindanitolerans]|uniref:EDD domain protein, DegV family n=1 Tax=Edaphobacillus lindanitolerans TaxID=550447 RepID=A0A1U7PM81_9BACI|nr:DegV family protein [Edaphobacillus lindanitolerans]SIT68947.1 EDD domain protein, DegV family [Edaphobacillus lindanitolerans]